MSTEPQFKIGDRVRFRDTAFHEGEPELHPLRGCLGKIVAIALSDWDAHEIQPVDLASWENAYRGLPFSLPLETVWVAPEEIEAVQP